MAQLLKFDTEARQKLLDGLNTIAEAVGATLGPKGRNVSIERINMAPLIIHDGVTVARSIQLKDPFENQGAQLLVAIAQKTNDTAGDGTTTATVLAQALASEGLRMINEGANPQTIKLEIEEEVKKLLTKLKEMATPIQSDEELAQVATISCANPELGKLIAEAIKTVGEKGVVTVEESSGFTTNVEYKQGMEFDRGYLSSYFVTDSSSNQAVIEDAYILITDLKINHNFQLLPFLENFYKEGKKNLVIIGDVSEEALSTLVVNKVRGGLTLCAVQIPSYGARRLDELEDVATLTGGVVITQDSGRELESISLTELGRASKVTVDINKTIIVGGQGKQEALDRRIQDLETQIQSASTDYEKEVKKQRMAKLAGGVAIINVGGVTETEIKERRERVIDAVNATKAALEEGIVAGGEITLRKLADCTKNTILKKALSAPLTRLHENAGINTKDVTPQEYPLGVDVMDGEVKDLIKAGIIDPVKVTRSALENAVSVATLLMTTSVVIVEEREEK